VALCFDRINCEKGDVFWETVINTIVLK
jgi:hypothetical protein